MKIFYQLTFTCCKTFDNMNYDSLIIPAKIFNTMPLLKVNEIATNEPKLWGPIGGFNTLVKCVRSMFAYNFVIPGNQIAWNNFLERLSFGLIKETVEHGTTSVSFGVAQTIKWKKSDVIMGFGNGGTGGLKIQIVEQVTLLDETQFLKMGFESKGTGEEPNVNALQLGHWIPEKKSDFKSESKKLVVSIQKLKEQCKKRGFQTRMKLYTFTTGPSRAVWEKSQSQEEKDAMEADARAFYNSHGDADVIFEPWNGETFFMTQKEEAEMESKAAAALYKNLIDARLLQSNVTLVDTWGLGAGSCQFGQHLGIPIGMKDSEKPIFQDIVAKFEFALDQGLAVELLDQSQTYPSDANLVIALKSGFALLLNDKKHDWLLRTAQSLCPEVGV